MVARTVAGMTYHPWRELRTLAGWVVKFAPLPPGRLGQTDWATRTITLAPGMTQRQRRRVLAHELEHVRRGPCHPAAAGVEEQLVDSAALRRLMPVDALAAAVVWSQDLDELAEELWVTPAAVRARLAHLHPAERAYLLEVVRRAEP